MTDHHPQHDGEAHIEWADGWDQPPAQRQVPVSSPPQEFARPATNHSGVLRPGDAPFGATAGPARSSATGLAALATSALGWLVLWLAGSSLLTLGAAIIAVVLGLVALTANRGRIPAMIAITAALLLAGAFVVWVATTYGG